MATEVASVYAKIGADTSGLETGLKSAKTGMETFGATVKKIARAVASAFVIKAVFNFGKEIVADAMAAEDALAELDAVIKSTGGVSGMTSESVTELATTLSKLTNFEDDAIVAGESMLLTFTNIGKDVFPMATEAMLNMAQKFGGIDAASVQLGKALNDPIGGVTALRRVGVMLTDEQEAQIKSFMEVNDIASAQKVILGELETEFGGLAKAMGQTTQGKITRMKNAFKNLKETLGKALLPTIGNISEKLGNFLNDNMPAIEAFATKLGTWIGGAFETVWNWASKAWGEVKNFVGVFDAIFKDFAETGDINLAIDNFFEGFYDQLAAMGINVPAAKLWVQNLVAEFAWIPEGIAKIFDQSKGIVTTAYQGLLGGDVGDVAPVMDGITGQLSGGTKGLKTGLFDLGKTLWDFVQKGFLEATKILAGLSENIATWAKDPKTATAIESFGHDLATGTTKAFAGALGGGAENSDSIAGNLATIASNMTETLVIIGKAIGKGLVMGIAEELSSPETKAILFRAITGFGSLDEFKANAKAYFNNWAAGLNPLDPKNWMNLLTPGNSLNQNPVFGGAGANGLDSTVSRPTMFLAGERGTERVTITPNGKSQGGITVNVYTNDARTAGQSVIAALRARGAI